ncbi:predicted protein [Naegleria gruberi]|uniref:Predicted protein n=1 Tax=Naegleria gruberi TaxID=5762 RepID=D2VEV3_NAEGR|nr:uncharacterized protein NAEGRDRAFT_48966 [Naegleria gruberi]EFC44571.1 predicted protein [Naegleria gruberi]|eukprot:XP_002677315.1 predicted protein [Naegleria gruberi strain NEG-M]
MNLKQLARILSKYSSNTTVCAQFLNINVKSTSSSRFFSQKCQVSKESDRHNDIKCMYSMASSMKAVKSYQEALEFYQKIIQVSKTSHHHEHIGNSQQGHIVGMSWLESGNCLNSLNRYEEALNCFSTILNFHPNTFYQILGHYGRATCYFNMGKYREASHDYSQTILLFASKKSTQQHVIDSSLCYYHRALCHLNLNEYQQAISDFSVLLRDSSEEEIIELESNLALENEDKKLVVFFSRANAFIHANKLKRALDDINRGIVLHEKQIRHHNVQPHELYRIKAEILYSMKEFNKSRDNLLKAIQLNPTDEKAQLSLSLLNSSLKMDN